MPCDPSATCSSTSTSGHDACSIMSANCGVTRPDGCTSCYASTLAGVGIICTEQHQPLHRPTTSSIERSAMPARPAGPSAAGAGSKVLLPTRRSETLQKASPN